MPSTDTKPSLAKLDYSVLQQCIHCGMCLPSCPTYKETLVERHSPRGRISLMKAVAEKEIPLDKAFAEEMYYCLGCLACTSACPAGVDYANMFETARAEAEASEISTTTSRRIWRWLTLRFLFMGSRRLRLIGVFIRLYQQLGLQSLARKSGVFKILPENLQALEPSTPTISSRFSDSQIKDVEGNFANIRHRVGLLTGCVQDLAFSEVNCDTVTVLKENNCLVVTPRNQPCCGSLHAHNGELEQARVLARRTIDSFDIESLDAIISNSGGCGSHLKHYGKLLKDDAAYSEKARLWDSKLKDIHEWLLEIEFRPPPPLQSPISATYHPSCHLSHGQGIKTEPQSLLRKIKGLTLIPLKGADNCCGSAGIYNITHPKLSQKLQQEKVTSIKSTKAPVVLTANPGCHLQISNGLKHSSQIVMHPVSLLAKAYSGNDPLKPVQS
ncbi:(Fe-S)-binding protein [Puniceicoccaceae bacterium K14]|nr:(Fe-S)-binding protein [Puniceicoccaceae bacterium K14]